MADMTYNEARSVVDAIRAENDIAMARCEGLTSAFNRAADVLARAEQAEGMMRTMGPQTAKAKEDNKAALDALHETEALFKLLKAELDELNINAARQDRQRKDDAAKAIRVMTAEYEELKKNMAADFEQEQKSFAQSIDLLHVRKATVDADLAAAQTALAEVIAQTKELKARAEKAQALFDQ